MLRNLLSTLLCWALGLSPLLAQLHNQGAALMVQSGVFVKTTLEVQNTDGGTLAVNGTLDNGNGLLNTATITGTGTIVQSGASTQSATGVLAPGNNNVGTLAVTGNLDLGLGTYTCDINGAAGNPDLLALTGAATLTNATLTVNWLTNPVASGAYTVMTFGSRTGQFATVNVPAIPGFVITTIHSDTKVVVNCCKQTPPTITCPLAITRYVDPGSCATIVTYPDPSYSDNCATSTLSKLSGPASGASLTKGSHQAIWQVTQSGSGLTAQCTLNITVVDNIAPTITCPPTQSVSTGPTTCNASVTYNNPVAADNCTPAPTATHVSGGTGTVQGASTSTATFNKGTTTVQWKATDAAGLTKTCTFRIIVNDLEAPTMSCPAGLNVSASPGQCGATVTYSAPTYTDNCAPTSGTAVRVSGPPSGATFSVGTTNVVFRATDAASNTRQCTLTVTVTDDQPPSINCPSSTVVTGNGTPCRATVFYNAPTASDNCAGTLTPYLLSGLASGSSFPAGTTVNTFQATAPNGQTTQCSFTVTVNCPTNQPLPGTEDRTEAASGLWLTPNPAATAVTISIQGDQDASFGSLSVRDAAGRLVWEQTLKSSATLQLDVSAWPGGVYAVLWRQGKTATVKRLMVVKG